MKIRKMTKKDCEIYYQIINEKFKDEKSEIPSKNSIKKEFNRIIYSKDDVFLFSFDNSNKVVGYLHGKIKRNYWSPGGNIEYLFVLREFRRKGIATNLINHFNQYLKSRKLVKMTLNVNLKNKLAIKLYKKLGFEITSYVMKKKLK